MLRESQLFDTAIKGETSVLLELLGQDSCLLDRVSYTCSNKTTPLHIATMKGHVSFVKHILGCNPQLAEELDAQRSSPLHAASRNGKMEIVRALLLAAPDMCLSRDCQGRNPVHVAAMKGQVEVLKELVETCPVAAREKVDRGMTVLHLCVKYNRLEALETLVPKLSELVYCKDDDGDSILHMAARSNKFEIIQYLVQNTKIGVQTKNSMGQTPEAILEQSPLDPKGLDDIKTILKSKSKSKSKMRNSNHTSNQQVKWLTKKRDAIMVVAILIATMAFQAGVTPPGGTWQDDHLTQGKNGILVHKAGEAVIANNSPKAFKAFMRVNTTAFITSLSTILLLISGLPFRRKLFMWMLMVVMWLTITSIAATYAISISVVTPKKDKKSLSRVIEIGLLVWSSVMAILFVGNTIRLVDRWLKTHGIEVWRPKRFRNSSEVCNV